VNDNNDVSDVQPGKDGDKSKSFRFNKYSIQPNIMEKINKKVYRELSHSDRV
jgi:hypothetical protein